MNAFLRRMALAIGLITALNPDAHVWLDKNVLHIENKGEVHEIHYQITEIGEAWNSEQVTQFESLE